MGLGGPKWLTALSYSRAAARLRGQDQPSRPVDFNWSDQAPETARPTEHGQPYRIFGPTCSAEASIDNFRFSRADLSLAFDPSNIGFVMSVLVVFATDPY